MWSFDQANKRRGQAIGAAWGEHCLLLLRPGWTKQLGAHAMLTLQGKRSIKGQGLCIP
jgi:hypothetical protein